MRFAVLGPVEARGTAGAVVLGGRQRRLLLAVLLSRIGRPVSADVLTDAMWQGAPSDSAATNLRWHIHQLRTALGDGRRTSTGRDGYTLHATDDEVDAAGFENLRRRGTAALDAGDTRTAEQRFRDALALWRGEAYGDLSDTPALRAESTRLEQLRLEVQEHRFNAGLRLGRHAELVAELVAAVQTHPFRENLRRQLMLALYRSGRRAEALDAAGAGRRLLAEQLGLDPGTDLQNLEVAILRDDPSLDLIAPAPIGVSPRCEPVPAELPADITAFTGRDTDLAELSTLLTGGTRGPLVLSSITGMAGIGKSAFAVHLAHQVAASFPDGQLYVNLHGATAGVTPLEPGEVLARFLRSLGRQKASQAKDVDELANHFRTATAQRKLLILLDDAAGAAQVGPLLPAGPQCTVLITSRRPLPTLQNSTCHHLDALDTADAVTLLSRLVGSRRVTGGDAIRLAELTGGMPLALRICAARLNARPDWTLRDLAERLTDERRRLTELAVDDLAVRASFEVGYRGLDAATPAARLFRLIGLCDSPDVTVSVATALANLSTGSAEDALGELVAAGLIERVATGRYRLHDLLRLFARETTLAQDSDDERADALQRVAEYYLATGRGIIDDHDPSEFDPLGKHVPNPNRPRDRFESLGEAREWITDEISNIIAMCPQFARLKAGAHLVLGLAEVITVVARVWISEGRMIALSTRALEATTQCGDVIMLCRAHESLGSMHLIHHDNHLAKAHLDEAIRMRRANGMPVPSHTNVMLGIIHKEFGDYEAAARHYADGLAESRAIGNDTNVAVCQIGLGLIYEKEGRIEAAVDAFSQAAATAGAVSDFANTAAAETSMADLHHRAGRGRRAIGWYRRTIRTVHNGHLVDTTLHANVLWNLAIALKTLGHNDFAREYRRQSVEILHRRNLITAEEKVEIIGDDDPATPAIFD